MAESIPEKDQFLIAYPNYVLRETVTYPNGGVSRFYDDGVDMVIIDDEICSCRDGEQIFPYTLITDKPLYENIPESVPIPGIRSGDDRKMPAEKPTGSVVLYQKDFRKRRACGLITAGVAV